MRQEASAKIAQALLDVGLRVWLDDWVIMPSDDIVSAIERGVASSRVLLLCMTSNTFDSSWVTLERNSAIFRDPANKERRFVPVLLADCEIPETMRRFRYIDYRDDSASALAQVVVACQPVSQPKYISTYSGENSVTGMRQPQEFVLFEAAKLDCAIAEIQQVDVLQFVANEAAKHPLLFAATFTSVPMIFGVYTMLLSWDGARAIVERILKPSEAYPSAAAWADCLALYRRAPQLSYRTVSNLSGPVALRHVGVALKSYRNLLQALQQLERVPHADQPGGGGISSHLRNLLEEAQTAVDAGDVGGSVSRLEAVLSTVHKFLLGSPPALRGPTQSTVVVEATTDALEETHAATVLLVEDSVQVAKIVQRSLQQVGFSVTVASSTVFAALTCSKSLCMNSFCGLDTKR